VSAVLATPTAGADNQGLSVSASLDLAFKQSRLDITVNGIPFNAPKPRYTSVVPSLAIGYWRIYGVITADRPLSEAHNVESGDSNANANYAEYFYKREETTATLGFRVTSFLNVFAGYINGHTDETSTQYNYNGATWEPVPNNIQFNEDGLFAGLSLSHAFGNKGTLAFSAAYGVMDGELISKSGNSAGTTKVDEATGYSSSLMWTGELGESTYYRIGIRHANYHFKFQSQAALTLDEPVTGLVLGVSKFF